MAYFNYLGHTEVSGGTGGECTIIRVRCTPETDPSGIATYLPIAPATYFPIGENMGYDIADPTSLRMLRANTVQFEEIV